MLAWQGRPQKLISQYIKRSLSTNGPAAISVNGVCANKVCDVYILGITTN